MQFTTPGTAELPGFSIPKAKWQQFSSVLDRKLGGIKLPGMQWQCLGVISILEGIVLVTAVGVGEQTLHFSIKESLLFEGKEICFSPI